MRDRVAEGFELSVCGRRFDVGASKHFLFAFDAIDVRASAEPSCAATRSIMNGKGAPEKPMVDARLVPEPRLHLVRVARARRGVPALEAFFVVVGVDDVAPGVVAGYAFGAPREVVPTLIVIIEPPIRPGGPNDLRHRISELAKTSL